MIFKNKRSNKCKHETERIINHAARVSLDTENLFVKFMTINQPKEVSFVSGRTGVSVHAMCVRGGLYIKRKWKNSLERGGKVSYMGEGSKIELTAISFRAGIEFFLLL